MARISSSSHVPDAGELVLPLSDVAHLFNAPYIDPMAASPPQVLGISGVDYLLTMLRSGDSPRRPQTLVIRLPPQEASPGLVEQIAGALHRHAKYRIEVEQRELRYTYTYGWRVAGVATVLLAAANRTVSLSLGRGGH